MISKFIFIVSALASLIYLSGCGKKQEPIAQMQEPISIEELARINASTQGAPEITARTEPAVIAPEVSISASSALQGQLEELPPGGPYKPTNKEIQAALKNSGFYAGLVDGKIGPLTKKAIEEFQKANSLKADAKVGPNTWALLSQYLNPVSSASTRKKR